MKHGGRTEKRIIPLISGTVGVISSFMQNVGAAALFIPVVSRISSRTGLPMSRLLMAYGLLRNPGWDHHDDRFESSDPA